MTGAHAREIWVAPRKVPWLFRATLGLAIAVRADRARTGRVDVEARAAERGTLREPWALASRRFEGEAQALVRFAQILAASGSLQDSAREMLEVAREAVDADRIVLRIHDHVTGDLVPFEGAGPLLGDHPPVTVTSGQGVGGSVWAFERGEVVIERDLDRGAIGGRRRSTAGMRSSVTLPVSSREATIGVLTAGSRRGDHFAPRAVELLTVAAASLGALLEIGRLRQEIEVERFIRERIDNFVSIASHELRTPMTVLVGYSELLMRGEPSIEVRQDWYSFINTESRRLTEIVDAFLDVGSISAGKLHLSIMPVALGPLAREVVARFARSAGHEIDVASGAAVPEVLADPDRVRQVLCNLLDNAVKYSPEGSRISVSFRTDNARGRVITSVSDEGTGIPLGERSKVFEMFQRGRFADTVTVRGAGLGLHIVKSLVEAMGGEVWLRSRRHRGSIFSIALPAAAHAISGHAEAAPQSA